jgi:hypothetical protein
MILVCLAQIECNMELSWESSISAKRGQWCWILTWNALNVPWIWYSLKKIFDCTLFQSYDDTPNHWWASGSWHLKQTVVNGQETTGKLRNRFKPSSKGIEVCLSRPTVPRGFDLVCETELRLISLLFAISRPVQLRFQTNKPIFVSQVAFEAYLYVHERHIDTTEWYLTGSPTSWSWEIPPCVRCDTEGTKHGHFLHDLHLLQLWLNNSRVTARCHCLMDA